MFGPKTSEGQGDTKSVQKISAMVMIMVVMAVGMMIITVGYEPHHSAILSAGNMLVGHDDNADDDDRDDDCDHQCWCLKCILH